MESNDRIIEKLIGQGVLPLFYHDDEEVCVGVTQALYDAGIRMIEFTNRGENALKNFGRLILERNNKWTDLLLAIGTIRSTKDATSFISLGADFLISPVFDAEVADIAYLDKKLWIPGCMTPTEIHVAANAGCKIVKLFPGNVLGSGFVSGIKELFPSMKFMPTGGVELNKENLKGWFDAGVSAVGMGSKLITKQMLQQRNYAAIKEVTRNAIQLIAEVRQK